jgi:hypothetical protein
VLHQSAFGRLEEGIHLRQFSPRRTETF